MSGVDVPTAREAAGRILHLEGAGLRLSLDPLRMRLELQGPGSQRLVIEPRVESDARLAASGDPQRRHTTAVGRIKGRAGEARRLEVQSSGSGQAGLRVTVEAPLDAAGVSLALAVENRTSERLALRSLGFAAIDGGVIALPPVARVLGLPSGLADRAERARRSRRPLRALRRFRDEMLLLEARDGTCLLAAHTTAARAPTRVACALRRGALRTLLLCTETAGRVLEPGELFESERAWLGFGDAAQPLLAEWARRLGCEMEARSDARGSGGWRSRCAARSGAPGQDALGRQLDVLRTLPGAKVVELAAGSAPAPGDAPRGAARLAAELAPLADRIREAGCIPAIALAPFVAEHRSRWLRDRPEALLRDARGRHTRVSKGRGRRADYALDATHPALLETLGATFEALRAVGFGAFTLERLGAAALPGARFDASRGAVEAYRDALRAIRARVGEEALLVGCGAPLGASVGLLDAFRIGAPAPSGWAWPWRGPPCRRSAGSGDAQARRLLSHAVTAQRLWRLDAARVCLDPAHSAPAAVQTQLSLAALGGGAILTGDDLARLDATRLAWLARALPPLARPVRALDPWAHGNAFSLSTPLLGERVAVVVWNPGARARDLGLDLAALGRSGAHHVYEFWNDDYLGVVDGAVPPRRVPPHGCRVLGLTPVARRPQVVGSTLHIGMGTLEVAALRATRRGALRLSLRWPGAQRGTIWIAAAGARDARPLAVRFEDAADLDVAP